MRRAMVTAVLGLIIGCSNPQQAAQIERLKSQLDDADRRLEVASEQLESAVDHAARLERAMAAAEQESAEAKREAEARSKQLARELETARSELLTVKHQLAEIARNEREEAARLSPVGVWAAGSKRFMFFANGTGVFQVWSNGWLEGYSRKDKREERLARSRAALERAKGELDGARAAGSFDGARAIIGEDSSGRFNYTPNGSNGEYLVRYRVKITRFGLNLSAERESEGDRVSRENVEETRLVELQFIVLSPDEARIIGQGYDSIVRRVDEDWTPQLEGE
jgi:hypothetical protein